MLSFLPRHWFFDLLSKDSIFSLDKDSISIDLNDIFIVVSDVTLSFYFPQAASSVTVSLGGGSKHRNYGRVIASTRHIYYLINGNHREDLTVDTAIEKLISLSNGVLLPNLVDGRLSIIDNQFRFSVQIGFVTVLDNELRHLLIPEVNQGKFTTPNETKYDFSLKSFTLRVTEIPLHSEVGYINYVFDYRNQVAVLQTITFYPKKHPYQTVTINRNKSKWFINSSDNTDINILLPDDITHLIETADSPSKMTMVCTKALEMITI